jgi:endonuclease YncB( thermonuclease family)
MKVQTGVRIASAIRRQPRGRVIVAACVFAIVLLSLVDHLGAFGYHGDDWKRFDQKSFHVTRAIDGDTIEIAGNSVVRLLGANAPQLPSAHWSENAANYLSARTLGRDVTLKLDTIQSRNDGGELLAYAFITDADNLNADIIRDGQAYADRRVKHTLASQFVAAETEARKKPRGLWINITEDQMPRWRRDWLRSMQK